MVVIITVLIPKTLLIFLLPGQNTSKKLTSRRKSLFWFTVLEVSVHGNLVPLFLGLMVEEHRTSHGSQDVKTEKKGRIKDKIKTLKSMPFGPIFFH